MQRTSSPKAGQGRGAGGLEAGGQGEGELTECGGLGQASGDAGCGLAEG